MVDALGEHVRLKPGDRVAMLSGQSYATHEVVDEVMTAKLPPTLDGPFPGEAIGCAMNIFRRSDIRAGQTVAIIGIGFLGAMLTRLCADAGARVIAVSRRPSSLQLARIHGANNTVPMLEHRAVLDEVRTLTDGRNCERVIEAVGYQWPLDLAGELVAEGGRLVIAGYHQDGPRQVDMQMWNWKGIDIVSAHERDPAVQMAGLRGAIDAVAAGRIDLAPLMTHRYPLERLGEALDATRDKPDGFVKAWIDLA